MQVGISQSSCFCCPRRTVQQERFGVLRVVNSTGADTGEYACYPLYCEDADCRREYDKAAKVFVFFPGTKPKWWFWSLFFQRDDADKTSFFFFSRNSSFLHTIKKITTSSVWVICISGQRIVSPEHKVYWASNAFIVQSAVFIWKAWHVLCCYHSNSTVTTNELYWR